MKQLYIVCGAPGSGKSTYINQLVRDNGGAHISRDAVRYSIVKDNEDYFSHEVEVFNKFISLVQSSLDNYTGPVYADASHLNEKSRNKLLNRLRLNDVELNAICLRPSLSVCYERNAKRSGRENVPNHIIKSMYDRFCDPSTDRKYKYNNVIFITD